MTSVGERQFSATAMVPVPRVSSPGPRGERVVHFGRVFDEGEVSRNVKMVPLYTSSQVYYELLGDALLGRYH